MDAHIDTLLDERAGLGGFTAFDASVGLIDQAPATLFCSPSRLAILDHFRQRRQRQEQAADKLRAQEFVMGT